MATFSDVLDQLRENQPQGKYGLAFEKLMVNFFRTDPTLAPEFDQVYRWVDWPFNGGKADTGIDLVARRVEDGRWVAIQCKFYRPTTHIQKGQLDSFFEASGRSFTTEKGVEFFAQRYIISTTDLWSSHAEEALRNQQIPVSRIGFSDIQHSPVNWDVVFPGSEIEVHLTRRETFEPRPHQATAIEKTLEGFKTHDREKLIMACGTGKTFTALRLAERVAQEHNGKARVLFLVPSIALLSQSLKEWTAQATMELKAFAVCSDSKAGKQAEDIAAHDLEVQVSTSGADIAARYERGKRAKALNVVFSTYQSIQAVHDAQQLGLEDFDLIICDEAHRTTGVTLAGEDESNFVKVHDPEFIRASKRLYMTATPRLFDESVKDKAVQHSAELASMDDEAVYGPELHRLGFGEAVEKGLLTDYRVLVMTVDEDVAAEAMALRTHEGMNLTTASAMIGAWNGLAKRSGGLQGKKGGFDEDAEPMRRTVAFAKDIKTSKLIAESFPALVSSHQQLLREHAVLNDVSLHNVDLEVAAQHVDGSMNALERGNKISWLEADIPANETRVLTNARCLSEGVDVPALDSVVFFNPRNSMVDVVQSVGRVMRKSEGKDYGYVILPVAVPPGVSPSEALNDNQRFKVVWQILNALRAHDDRFNAKVNSIGFNEGNISEIPLDVDHVTKLNDKLKELDGNEAQPYDDSSNVVEQIALFSLEQWQEAIYTKLVDKVGTRTYWEDWADDVADISKAQVTRIRALLDQADATLRGEFDTFVEGLRGNLNDSISEDEAISMLSQHLITAPVFDALFSEHDFAAHNPVSQVMQRMVDALDDSDLDAETDSLEKFYASVRVRASEVTSASGKQQVIKELYERFFKKGFKRDADKLGIVYTPVEIVDFILRAADDVSKKHFGRGLSDESVHILDPFTGTGTFMVRLLQSGLIDPKDLARKYANELHATEIMLLAYYVAAVNIETTFNALQAEAAQREGLPEPEYVPFEGIALADTFQIHEDGDILDLTVFKNNNERIVRQKEAPINVIVGNPPYSAGQKNANDNNANLKYPTLDARIAETYVAKSTAQLKNSLYDSYLRAFRWATDRIGAQGIVAFVSNGGWLDGNSGDGIRLSLAEDFSDIYLLNLRGNARTSGEPRKKEAGNVFGSGSRTPISITICVKNPNKSGFELHYRDIGDYLSAEEKLAIVDASTIENIEWQSIIPNEYGDWLNQRSDEFETWPIIGEKKGDTTKFFSIFSGGLKTNRDSWVYRFSQRDLETDIKSSIEFFNSLSSKDEIDPKRIKWSSKFDSLLTAKRKLTFDPLSVREVMYRPFSRQHCYFNPGLNDRQGRLPTMFPTQQHSNIGIYIPAASSASRGFNAQITTYVPDLSLSGSGSGQFFPRFTWEPVDAEDGGLFGDGAAISEGESTIYGQVGEVVAGYVRKDNITDAIKALYRDALGADVTGDDIFYFVYGKLHDPNYRETYAADLKKMLPHIETPGTRAEFDKFARAGKELMELHVGYEDVQPYPLDIEVKGDESDPETWRVITMKWAKKKVPGAKRPVDDVTKLIYNKRVTITGIPAEADGYMLGARSALAWLIYQYRITKDTKYGSGIINDPNDWSDEVGNLRYIVDLIGKVTRVAVETVRIVEGLR